MTAEILIKTTSLRREYGETVAVNDVNLDVARGAVVALVGQNGAGKTTLLKMLAGLLEATRGTATVEGLDIREHPREIHSKIGFLPDFFGLYDDLTVNDYLDYFGRAYRLPNQERQSTIQRVLSQVGLESKQNSLIDALSRGMRQKVAIARTLIHNPPLLLLDEPASGLDPEARYEIQSLFRSLAQSGKTLIVSSHILSELEDYCTYVAMLHQGVLVASGAVDEVRKSLVPHRRIRLRVASESSAVASVLTADANVSNVKNEGKTWTFFFSAQEEEVRQLLKRLISAEVPVVFFEEEQGTIQDSYLALMGKQR